MRSTLAVSVLSLALATYAQEACLEVAAALPSCAVPCISSAGSGVGCELTDFACQCSASQSAAIQSAAQGCIVKSCGIATGLEVRKAAASICNCVKTAAPANAETTSASAPEQTSAAAAEVTSDAAPAETTVSSMPAETGMTSSAAGGSEAPAPTATGTVPFYPSGNASSTANSTSSVTPFEGEAVGLTMGLKLVGSAAVGVAVLLAFL